MSLLWVHISSQKNWTVWRNLKNIFFTLQHSLLWNVDSIHSELANIFSSHLQDRGKFCVKYSGVTRGRILGRNWDKSKEFSSSLFTITSNTEFTPPTHLSKSGLKLVCNVNTVLYKSENDDQDYAQKHQRNCTFMNSWIFISEFRPYGMRVPVSVLPFKQKL